MGQSCENLRYVMARSCSASKSYHFYLLQDKFFNKNDLLHPNLVITKEEVLVMLMHIFMRHNLSNSALEDILRLINVVLGFSSLPNTFYSFMSYFGTQQLVRHFVCKGCGLYMGTTPEEKCNMCRRSEKNIFISFDMITNLRSILLKNWDKILAYGSSLIDGQFSDILQGKVAFNSKTYNTDGSYNILISFNTDGVAVFNSNIKKIFVAYISDHQQSATLSEIFTTKHCSCWTLVVQ